VLRAGLTGGIGSGKTTVCKLFEQLGVPVYYADEEAKKLYVENARLKAALIKAFGPEVYTGTEVNKEFLRSLLLSSPKTTEQLNALVHPFVFEHYEQWCEQHQGVPYTIKEAAILFESGGFKRVQKVVGVVASIETRISRVMKRDNITRAEVEARMKRQWKQEEWLPRCDYVIENDNGFDIQKQVSLVHSMLLKESKTNHPFVK
jgi:dephospho-CoA kinase